MSSLPIEDKSFVKAGLLTLGRSLTWPGVPSEHGLEDAAGLNDEGTVVVAAVADGVTHSFRSKTLADAMVSKFLADRPRNEEQWQQAWSSIRNDWYEQHTPQWNSFKPVEQEQFLDPGSHSTFHGIIVERSSEQNIVISSYYRGDAIAIWIDEFGSLVLYDPKLPLPFTNNPRTLGVKQEKLNWSGFHVRYTGLPARYLFLATDKLAEFLIRSFDPPNQDLLNQLKEIEGPAFGGWCDEQKERGLTPDDYSFVLLGFNEHLPIDPESRPFESSENPQPVK